MYFYHYRLLFFLWMFTSVCKPVASQDSTFNAKHAAIIFPYPMYHEKWRASIGFTLLTTPEDITEEVRIRIPCGDFRALRRVNDRLELDARVMFQLLQNHFSVGLRYVLPANEKLFFSLGDDIGYWFGILKLSGFDSKASGWANYPNFSVGYKTKKNLLITLNGQVSYNYNYQAANGQNKFSAGEFYYNGETFTLSLEQPFTNKKHLTLAVSAINNYFYWQTWSLYYRTNRKVFYPQVTVALIL